MNKLAIIGTAPSSLYKAPYNNPEYDLWGLNGLFSYIDTTSANNFTRWFEMHILEDAKKNTEIWDFLKRCPYEVVMQEQTDEIPKSVRYPIEEVLKLFPRKYFSSTVSWQIGLAVLEGYTDISLYGIDMALDTEYGSQKPSCEYMIGYCEGKGIKVYIPPESDLLKAEYLYGYEAPKMTDLQAKYNARYTELGQRIDECDMELNYELVKSGKLNLLLKKAYLIGCKDDTEYYLRKRIN